MKDSTNILYLTLQALPGLSGGIFRDWIEAFHDIGCEVSLVTQYWNRSDMHSNSLPCKMLGFERKRILPVPAGIGYMLSMADAWRIAKYANRLCEDSKFEYVVINEPNLAPFVLRSSNLKLLKSVFIAHLTTLGRDPIYGLVKQSMLDWANRLAVKESKYVIALTDYHKTVFAGHRGCDDQIYVIPNSVYVPESEVNQAKRRKGNHYLWIGEFSEGKDPYLAVKAALLHLEKYPHSSFTFVGKGKQLDGAKRMASGVRQLSFLGAIYDQEKIKEIRSSANVFIFTTHFETFGRVLVESMAYGHTCVVSDIPTLRAIGKDAILYFEKGSLKHLCEQLDRCEQSNELRCELGTLSRKYAISGYTQYVQKTKLSEFFDSSKSI